MPLSHAGASITARLISATPVPCQQPAIDFTISFHFICRAATMPQFSASWPFMASPASSSHVSLPLPPLHRPFSLSFSLYLRLFSAELLMFTPERCRCRYG